MSKLSTRIAAVALSTVALAGIASTANAATTTSAPTKADKVAMVASNKVCAPVTDDYGYEACVLGEFVQRTGRMYVGGDYSYKADGTIKLDRAARVIASTRDDRSPSVPDKAAIKISKQEADYATTADQDAQYIDVIVGDFILDRGRFINEDMLTFKANGTVGLSQHSVWVRI